MSSNPAIVVRSGVSFCTSVTSASSKYGSAAIAKVIIAANKRQHRRAEKALRKEYGDLFRPEKLYDMSSVANIDVFADNCRKIVKDVFTWQKFTFLTEEDINITEELNL